jgi:hypothetical protein
MAMQGDSESRLPPTPQRDLWALPEIKTLKVERVRYRSARKHVIAGKVIEVADGIEIVVQTDGEIPIRALSPALHVGSAEIAENERVSETSYRFFVLDEKALRPGAPITLGWVGHPAPKGRARFRYETPGAGVTRER